MYSNRFEDNCNLFFLHIPKTAGTALNHFIMKHYKDDETIFGQRNIYGYYNQLWDIPVSELEKLKYISGHINYSFLKRMKKDFISFTVIRNPVDRTISLYYYLKYNIFSNKDYDLINDSKSNSDMIHYYNSIVSKKSTFEEFVKDKEVSRIISNAQTKALGFDGTNITLSEYMDRKYLEIAKKRLEEFTFVGTTDNLDDVFLMLSYYCNWFPEKNNVKINESKNKIDKNELSDNLLEHLNKILSLDFELHEKCKEISLRQKENIKYNDVLRNFNKKIASSYKFKDLKDINIHDVVFISGFYKPDSGITRWSQQDSLIYILHNDISSDFRATLKLKPLVSDIELFKIKIFGNDSLLQYVNKHNYYEIVIKKDMITKDNILKLRFKLEDIYSPFDLKINDDKRKLGFVLNDIKFELGGY